MLNNGVGDARTMNTGSCTTRKFVTQSVSHGQNSVSPVVSNSHRERASNASATRLEELFTSKRTVTNVSDSRRPSHSRRPSTDEISVGPRSETCDHFQQSSSFSRSDSPTKWKIQSLSGSRDCSGGSSGSKFPLCNTNTAVVPSDRDGERSLTPVSLSSKDSLQEIRTVGNLVNTSEVAITTASKTDLLNNHSVSSLPTELTLTQRSNESETRRLEELFTSKRTVTNVSDSRRPSHSRRPSTDEISVGPRSETCDHFQQSSSFSRSDSPTKWKIQSLSGSRDCSGGSSGSKFPLCNTNTAVVPSDRDGERSLTPVSLSSKDSLQEIRTVGNLVNTSEVAITTASKTDLLNNHSVSSLPTELTLTQRPQPSILGNCSQLPNLTGSTKDIYPTQEGSEVVTCERRAEQHTDMQSGVTVVRMNNPDVKSRQDLPSDFDRPHLQPYVGLYNHGNTCYMSAIFQCLRFTPALFKACAGHPEKAAASEKLLQSLAVLFRSMADKASHRKLYDDVERVRTEIGRSDPCYKSSEQQDALEFLVCLLDSLHSEIQHSGGGKLDCFNVSITTNVCLSPQPLDIKPSELHRS
ncbi:hypothetical protein AHF37_01223 [Paragonimus kellicotti]|nr:hypothetical protein AHF37_01223 [Paragonimus kellicotti]